MNIQLPPQIEDSISAAVHGGYFASVEEAMTEAARMLLRDLSQRPTPVASPVGIDVDTPDPLLGLMRDDTDLMDEIVAEAYRRRREEKPRDLDL